MDRRIRSCLAGLLTLLCFFCAEFFIFPQDNSFLNIQTSCSSLNPAAGDSWTFTILVDHPVTGDVIVRAPVFPDSMIVERVRTQPRYAGQIDSHSYTEADRWTAVEYLFTLRSAGTFTLEPFSVTAGARQASTKTVTITVSEDPANPGRTAPLLRWEKIPQVLYAGEESGITLVLYNWNPGKNIPVNLLRGRTPENFVLEEMPFVSGSENSRAENPALVIHYPFRIIALNNIEFLIRPFTIEADNEILEIPEIKIPVVANMSEANTAPSGPVNSERMDIIERPDSVFDIPFPVISENIFPLFDIGYNIVLSRARGLWMEGSYAGALAFVRMNERDSYIGPLFKSIRAEMEHSLGLSGTPDENWIFWVRCITPAAGFLILLAAVTIHLFGGFKRKNTKLILGGAGIILIIAGMAGFFLNPQLMAPVNHTAILRETAVYRVPDSTGAVNAVFGEGQPVIIRSSPHSWFLVESFDGRQGWAPAEAVIPY